MRNPNRIFDFANYVGHLWYTYCPDWRFMQLMSNFISWYGEDPFYLEDEKLCKLIDKYFRETFDIEG